MSRRNSTSTAGAVLDAQRRVAAARPCVSSGVVVREVGDLVAPAAPAAVLLEGERLLAVRVAAAAVGAHLARPHLVPGLRHVEHQAVAVERLERERRVGRNLREEAGVGIALGIEDRAAAGVELAQRDLAEDAQPLHRRGCRRAGRRSARRSGRSCDACSAPSRAMRTAQMSPFVYLPASAPCHAPVAALPVLAGVEGVEAVEGVRPRRHEAGEALALVEAARADEAVRRAGRAASACSVPSFGSHGSVAGSATPCTARYGTTARGQASL